MSLCLCGGERRLARRTYVRIVYRKKWEPKSIHVGRKGGLEIQNPELSCVSTSLKTRHTNINSFVFNAFKLILWGVER